MVVKRYGEVSQGYEKMRCGLKNIVIRGSIKVYSMHIIKQSYIFNLETM